MATKLKNLRVKKVDFVDEGANPDAHIRLTKKRDSEQSVGEDVEKGTGMFHKVFSFIGKAAGMNQDEIDSAMDEIQKVDSVSFNEKINEVKNYKIADEMWDTCYALQSSLCSILNDEEMDSTEVATAMQESLDEFYAVVQESIKEWSSGKSASIVRKNEVVTDADIELMKSAVARLNDSIEKKYGTEGEVGAQADESTATEPGVQIKKSGTPARIQIEGAEADDGPDDIYKGMHPAVKAELESLKKFREDAENEELCEVAKKYELIGKKADELVPVLKSLKAAGGTAYNDMIAVLDQTVETVEKSGVFSEIGKAGHSNGNENSAEVKIGTIAKGYMEKNPSLSYNQAIARAWENNPDLMAEYDEQEGF